MAPWWRTGLALFAILGLLALRVPAWVAPVGSDQYLYLYIADRLLDGEVPYRDAWDQKPPGIYFLYASLRAVWQDSSVVALADLGAAAAMAWALVMLGRQTLGALTGWTAAAIAVFFGHPSLSRLDGVYVRGQCEAFIAPAIVLALALLTRARRRQFHILLAGLSLGLACWLKYNSLTYLLPVALALVFWPTDRLPTLRTRLMDGAVLMAGFLIPGAAVLTYFAAHGALEELRLATFDYNVQYSRETYGNGVTSVATYLVTMPVGRARTDFLWFLGLFGAALLCLIGRTEHRRVSMLVVASIAAAVLSIAINGARDLPQYFVQAIPVMAFAAAAGLSVIPRKGIAWSAVTTAVVVVGLWKVGVETPSLAGFRWAGLPQLADNLRFDLEHMMGRSDRRTYLARFKGVQKYDALANHDVAELVRQTTAPGDRILVFGFAPGIYVESGRKSASRFFWSRPVILEFEAERASFGSAGLVADLERVPPALVALQQKDWAEDAQSAEFFLSNPALREWLIAGYSLEVDGPAFSLWRRKG